MTTRPGSAPSAEAITIERRVSRGVEIRVPGPDAKGEGRISGYAAVFNTASEDLGGFTEMIAPGAFRAALLTSDTRALFNHDPNYVLGRVRAGTLQIAEDGKGLQVEATFPDVQWARDLSVSVARGDVDQMSFGFRVAKGGDEWVITDEAATRTITAVQELLDVSVVTYPAYPDTTVAIRSLDAWRAASSATLPVAIPPAAIPPAVQRDLRRRRHRLLMTTMR